MGMFDYIHVGTTLPEIPQGIIENWGSVDKISFQTKDTPNQAMSAYKIDGAGQLWVEKTEGHWEEGEEVPEDASIGTKLAAIGRYVVDDRWWVFEDYTGAIQFYESYSHEDYNDCELASCSDDWMRFEYGWIEYRALFKNGKLIEDIELVEHKKPQKLSDEELQERKDTQKKRREETETTLKERRKNSPSPEQKLIDNIDRECRLVETNMDETDVSLAISNIRIIISEYRTKHDPWY
jgi:hypothetical protein